MNIRSIRFLAYLTPMLVFASGWCNANDSTNKDDRIWWSEKDISIQLKGKIEQKLDSDWNYDLNDSDNDGKLVLEPNLSLAILIASRMDVSAALKFEFARELELNEDEVAVYESSLEVDEGYIRFGDYFKTVDWINKSKLTVGRFKVSDKRNWYFDKKLDGLALSFGLKNRNTEVSFLLNRENLFGADMLRDNRKDPVNNFILMVEHTPNINLDVDFVAYSVVRDDRSSDNDSPVFYGLGSYGHLADKRFKFWSDLAWVRGKNSEEHIKGYGWDIGTTMFLDRDERSFLTLGYAFGSGNGNVDTDFRQTDLQGNSGRFGGGTSFKYYGELLDPDLSNMHIFTVGVGFIFSSALSVDIVFHHYKQDEPLDNLRSVDIDLDPDGIGSVLGSELDFVLGFSPSKDVESEVVLSYFQPGRAFGTDADDAVKLQTKLSYKF